MWEIDIVHKRVPVVGVHGPTITRGKKTQNTILTIKFYIY